MRNIFILLALIVTPLAHSYNEEILPNYNFDVNGYKVALSGILATDAVASNYDQGAPRFTNKKSYFNLDVKRIYGRVGLEMLPWLHAKAAANFLPRSTGFNKNNDGWSFHKYWLDEAALIFNQPELNRYFGSAGIQYLPYGSYARHKIATFTQLLTQTQEVSAVGGILQDSFEVKLFLARDKKPIGGSNRPNLGVQGTFTLPSYQAEEYKPTFTLGYMNNIVDTVDYLAKSPVISNGYHKQIGGIFMEAQTNYQPWLFTVQYTSALNNFDYRDTAGKVAVRPTTTLAQVDYSFLGIRDLPTKLSGNVQVSWQGTHFISRDGRGLPKLRLQGIYTIDIMPWLISDISLLWDKDYAINHGGTGKKSLTAVLGMSALLS